MVLSFANLGTWTSYLAFPGPICGKHNGENTQLAGLQDKMGKEYTRPQAHKILNPLLKLSCCCFADLARLSPKQR